MPSLSPSDQAAHLTGISIVIPTLNEVDNVGPLLQEIKKALGEIPYECVIVDDHSTDGTVAALQALGKQYPLQISLKQGSPGKAQSLLQGFKLARYATIAMIDADLQYPPKAIPEMYALVVNNKADIVVANRVDSDTPWIRQSASHIFDYVFSYLLHGLKCDVQSGLKLFRHEAVENLHIDPTPWSFDMHFLLEARAAGYRIGTVDIFFNKRERGASHIRILKVTYELARSAIRLKFRKRGAPLKDTKQIPVP